MSDNINVTPGSGVAVAADEVGAVFYQRVKVGIGVENVVPTDLAFGAAAAAASLPVTQSTEDVARMGSLTETAPTTDTASSGLNGRLQRLAQKLTATNAGIGAIGDAAWTSGDGSMIAVLKALASDTTAADTNLTKIGGAAVGAANPLFTRKGSTNKKRQAVFKSKTTILTGAQVIDTLFISNQDTAVGYLQIFDVSNANTGTITLGTTVPDFEFDLNANQKLIMSGLNLSLANGFIAAVTTTSGGGSAVAGSGFTLSYTYN